MSGIRLAALYGIYPHRLGFCGPQKNRDKRVLLDYLSGQKFPEEKIRGILEEFEGAFPYYKLIAKSNNIKDPFNEKVVKAYWIGNRLLEKVSVDSLRKMIIKEFSKPGLLSKHLSLKKAKETPLNSKPHHSFHALVMGSVTGRIVLKGKLLDFCRIGWGKVIQHKLGRKNKIMIEYQPVREKNERYFLGEPIEKLISWDRNLVLKINIGDTVSVHWNYLIQILNKGDLANLKKYTQITIESLNDKAT